MATFIWKRVKGGSPSARVFSAYLALVLTIAMVGPGLSVYAADGDAQKGHASEPVVEAEPVEPVVEEPVVEAEPVEPVVEEPVVEAEPVEPVVEAAVEAAVEEPVVKESVESLITASATAVVAAVVAPQNSAARPICEGGVKLDSDPRSGTYTYTSPKSEVTPTTPDDFEITIVVHETDDGMTFDFTSNYPVSHVAVKGGSGDEGYMDYNYDPPVYSAEGLHAPVNPSGDYADISHIIFCFGVIEEPEEGDLIVYKYHDLNENGAYDDGEPMLEDWEFTLTQSTPPITASAISLVATGTTDVDGELLFGGLEPGEYTVTETLQSGWTNTTPLSQDVTVVDGQTASLWFGNIPTIEEPEEGDLIVYKFEDLNENGLFDEGEPMLEDWEFTLSVGDADLDSGLTDANGELLFGGLEPGEYTVTETLQDGWTNTTPLSQDVTVVDGQTASLWFGNIEEFLPFTELDLAITKLANKAEADPGELITYTLTYWNTGELVAYNFTITDDFDERYVTVVDAAGGTVADGKITWALAGPLAMEDGKQTITYTVRVKSAMPDGVTNVDNVVVIDHPLDSDPTNNTDDERVVVRVVEEEPFLPFTGGEYALLIAIAAGAATLGTVLRLRRDQAA